MVTCSIQYSNGMPRGRNIQGDVYLPNQNYLFAESLNVQYITNRMAIPLPMIITAIIMKYNSIKKLINGTHNDTQHQNNAHPNTSPIECDGVQLTNVQNHMVPISIL